MRESDLKAMERDKKMSKDVTKSMASVDDSTLTPERAEDRPFLMPVEYVASISVRGTMAVG